MVQTLVWSALVPTIHGFALFDWVKWHLVITMNLRFAPNELRGLKIESIATVIRESGVSPQNPVRVLN